MAPLPCLSRRRLPALRRLPDEETCRIREVFGSVFANYLLLIELLTLADLMRDEALLADSLPEPVRRSNSLICTA